MFFFSRTGAFYGLYYIRVTLQGVYADFLSPARWQTLAAEHPHCYLHTLPTVSHTQPLALSTSPSPHPATLLVVLLARPEIADSPTRPTSPTLYAPRQSKYRHAGSYG